MRDNFEQAIKKFNYSFPQELIAQSPANPRDSAKLLVYKKNLNKIQIDTFKNLTSYLPPKSVLVFNKTRVIPARLVVKKSTGGTVEILYIKHDLENIYVLSNRSLRPKNKLLLNNEMYFDVIEKLEKEYVLKPNFKTTKIIAVLERYGKTPLPPYIKHSTLSEKEIKSEYQTIFAQKKGSVAAPTASLHFTNSLLKKIKNAGHTVCFITLHVNLGTFAPLTTKQFDDKKLHEEWFEIDKKTKLILNNAKQNNRKIISVGTTVTRTLESSVNKDGKISKLYGTTNLFIDEDYKLKFVDAIITNFHVPKSSLLMLVASFTGRKKIFELYNIGIDNRMRLFSFGDGMLII